jgi:hypothetical protein
LLLNLSPLGIIGMDANGTINCSGNCGFKRVSWADESHHDVDRFHTLLSDKEVWLHQILICSFDPIKKLLNDPIFGPVFNPCFVVIKTLNFTTKRARVVVFRDTSNIPIGVRPFFGMDGSNEKLFRELMKQGLIELFFGHTLFKLPEFVEARPKLIGIFWCCRWHIQ